MKVEHNALPAPPVTDPAASENLNNPAVYGKNGIHVPYKRSPVVSVDDRNHIPSVLPPRTTQGGKPMKIRPFRGLRFHPCRCATHGTFIPAATVRLARAVLLGLLLMAATPAAADESAVRLDLPTDAAEGTQITITVRVFHNGNDFFHFTDWVLLQADGKEIARWPFSADQRPEAENFSRTLTYRLLRPTTFTAQANCNIHGSAGPVSSGVRITGQKTPAPPPATDNASGLHRPGRRGAAGYLILGLGVLNMLLITFQVASGRRWIKVKISVHRRSGQLLFVLALLHGALALFINL